MPVERGSTIRGPLRLKRNREGLPLGSAAAVSGISGMTPYYFSVVADLTGSLSAHRLSLGSTRGNTVVNAISPFPASIVAMTMSVNTALGGTARITAKPRVNGVVLTGSIQTSLRSGARQRLYSNSNLTSYTIAAGQTFAVTIDTNTTANQFAATDDLTIVLYTV